MNVMIHTLANRSLTPNQISGSKEKRRVMAKERKRLRAEASQAVQDKYGTEIPSYEYGLFDITYLHTFRRPKVEQCPRCLEEALTGDGRGTCECYRPTDWQNVSGDVIKGVVDGIVDMGVLPDDSYKYSPAGVIRIEKCDELKDEGYLVVVQPLSGGEG